MRSLARIVALCVVFSLAFAAMALAASDDRTIVIVFKDGHRQSFAAAEIARIDFKTPSVVVFKDGHQEKIAAADIARIEFDSETAMVPGRAHFVGKWEAGEGNGSNFYITLEADGEARKSIGSPHGTWTLVDGEARIAWDDGWHDIIRKVGTKHEKLGFAPGKSFDDAPSNTAPARNTEPKPI